MAVHTTPPPIEQRRLNKRNPQQPSQTAYWHPVYRGYPIYQQIERGPQVRDHLDRAFEYLRALQHRHSQVFAFRVDLRFPVNLEDAALYDDNQPIRDFLKAFTKEVQELSGQSNPALYVVWAREHNDQTRRRHVTDADLKDGEADLTKPHYHLFIAVHFAAFRRLGSFEPSRDGHYGDRSLAHSVIRSWQRVLGRDSERMPGIVHFAKCPESGKVQTFVIRRQDGPEGLIDPMKAISYLCKAYSKDTGKRLRTFQTCRIDPAIREAIWKQERARQEPVEAADVYQTEHRGCTTMPALDKDVVVTVRHWLLQPALLLRTAASQDWQPMASPEIHDLAHTRQAERRVKRLVGYESHQALEKAWVRIEQRGKPTGQAVLIHQILSPAWHFLAVEQRESGDCEGDGTRRVYDPVVSLYRETFQPLAQHLREEGGCEAGSLRHHPAREALYDQVIEAFYRLRGTLARPNTRAQVFQAQRDHDREIEHAVGEVGRLLDRHAGLQVVMLQVGHDPDRFRRPGTSSLAQHQQALDALLQPDSANPLFPGLAGLFWKRDHGLTRQHVIHLIAFYHDDRCTAEQRREAIADHWLHSVTRGEGAAYRVFPNAHNVAHLLTPNLDWVTARDSDKREALRRQLRGLLLMDRLTHLALPKGTPEHGWHLTDACETVPA